MLKFDCCLFSSRAIYGVSKDGFRHILDLIADVLNTSSQRNSAHLTPVQQLRSSWISSGRIPSKELLGLSITFVSTKAELVLLSTRLLKWWQICCLRWTFKLFAKHSPLSLTFMRAVNLIKVFLKTHSMADPKFFYKHLYDNLFATLPS